MNKFFTAILALFLLSTVAARAAEGFNTLGSVGGFFNGASTGAWSHMTPTEYAKAIRDGQFSDPLARHNAIIAANRGYRQVTTASRPVPRPSPTATGGARWRRSGITAGITTYAQRHALAVARADIQADRMLRAARAVVARDRQSLSTQHTDVNQDSNYARGVANAISRSGLQ